MDDLTRRAYQSFIDLEVRDDADGGRRLRGIAVPFDEPTPIRDAEGEYLEVFRRGAFRQTINRGVERVKLLAQHNRADLAFGRAELLREDPAGLFGEFLIPRTQMGDEVLELARAGVLDAFSIGFVPLEAGTRWNEDRTFAERTEVALREVSVVNWGAFEGARITGVREWMPEVSVPEPSSPDGDRSADEEKPDPSDVAEGPVVEVAAPRNRELLRLRARWIATHR